MRPLVASPGWTPEEDEILQALVFSGTSVAEIAKRLKRSRAAVYTQSEQAKDCAGQIALGESEKEMKQLGRAQSQGLWFGQRC